MVNVITLKYWVEWITAKSKMTSLDVFLNLRRGVYLRRGAFWPA